MYVYNYIHMKALCKYTKLQCIFICLCKCENDTRSYYLTLFLDATQTPNVLGSRSGQNIKIYFKVVSISDVCFFFLNENIVSQTLLGSKQKKV